MRYSESSKTRETTAYSGYNVETSTHGFPSEVNTVVSEKRTKTNTCNIKKDGKAIQTIKGKVRTIDLEGCLKNAIRYRTIRRRLYFTKTIFVDCMTHLITGPHLPGSEELEALKVKVLVDFSSFDEISSSTGTSPPFPSGDEAETI